MKEATIKKGSSLLFEKKEQESILKAFELERDRVMNISFQDSLGKAINFTGPRPEIIKHITDAYVDYLKGELIIIDDEIKNLTDEPVS